MTQLNQKIMVLNMNKDKSEILIEEYNDNIEKLEIEIYEKEQKDTENEC